VLATYAQRYARVAELAGGSFPSTFMFDVVVRVPGGPTSTFAAPECRRRFPQVTAEGERAASTPAVALRLAGLVTAGWATFEEDLWCQTAGPRATRPAGSPGMSSSMRGRCRTDTELDWSLDRQRLYRCRFRHVSKGSYW
jgi:hypothetical protein